MNVYRIRDWSKHFENNRTRELKRMEWIPVPNKHDGSGFTALLDDPNGVAHYGAWHLILQVASKCDPRGTLLRESAAGGKAALTCDDIGRMSHSPAGLIQEALDRLVIIGWIEVYDDPAPSCGIAAPSCASRARAGMEWNGMERKGMEVQNTHLPVSVPAGSSAIPLEPEGGCVNLPLQAQKRKFELDTRFTWLERELCRWYKRSEDQQTVGIGEEQHLVAEVARRPHVKAELDELKSARREIGEQYFPQSLGRLCRDWDATLDRARNHAAPPKPPEQQHWTDKALEAHMKREGIK